MELIVSAKTETEFAMWVTLIDLIWTDGGAEALAAYVKEKKSRGEHSNLREAVVFLTRAVATCAVVPEVALL